MKVVLIRGGGDLASGVVFRLKKVGINVIITELSQPLAVRRKVAFSEAIFQDETMIEGIIARRCYHPSEIDKVLTGGEVPVFVDPDCQIRNSTQFEIIGLVDARMKKKPPDIGMEAAPIVVGLGPGFNAGENCHAVIETNRGHYLGRVIWIGSPEPNTGVPGIIRQKTQNRVLRAPTQGKLESIKEIGMKVKEGEVIAFVSGEPILAGFTGILRGLLRNGTSVIEGMKVGDLDPRNDPRVAFTISEKALAIGGGVLEALLTNPEVRHNLWN